MPTGLVHGLIGNSFAYYALIVTVWALILFVREKEVENDLRIAAAFGEGVIVLEIVGGFLLMSRGLVLNRPIHLLCGLLAAVPWPVAFVISRGSTARQSALYWTLASGVVLALVLCAAIVATPPV